MDPSTTLVLALVDSRPAPDRGRLAGQVELALASLRQKWSGEWQAQPMTTRGLDQISGLLRRPHHAFDAFVALNEAVWPCRYRGAIVSGPVFHRAAGALRRAEDSDLLCAFDLEQLERPEQDLLEALARLHGSVMAQWKPSRFRAATAMRRTPTQQTAAAALGITQQSISEALRAGQFAELVAAEDAIRGLLSRSGPDSLALGGSDR